MILALVQQKARQWHALAATWRPRVLLAQVLIPLAVLTLLLALWQIYTSASQVSGIILPSPLQVTQATIGHWPVLQPALLVTLNEALLGFAWALAFGIGSAAMLDLLPIMRQGIYPLLIASQSIPIIALAPLMQFWFGTDLTTKVLIIVLSCFFPITVASLDGLHATDPELLRLYRSFGASPWQIFWAVRLPHALPSFFSGVRIAISYALISALFSEYIGATNGLVIYMRNSQHALRTDLVIGAIAVTALASVALFLLVMLVERLVIPWFYAERNTERRQAA